MSTCCIPLEKPHIHTKLANFDETNKVLPWPKTIDVTRTGEYYDQKNEHAIARSINSNINPAMYSTPITPRYFIFFRRSPSFHFIVINPHYDTIQPITYELSMGLTFKIFVGFFKYWTHYATQSD